MKDPNNPHWNEHDDEYGRSQTIEHNDNFAKHMPLLNNNNDAGYQQMGRGIGLRKPPSMPKHTSSRQERPNL